MRSLLDLTLVALLCLRVTVAASPSHSNWQQRNYDTINAIYNLTIYPNNQAFLTQGIKAVPPGLFSANVKGRITPVGNFTGGVEDSLEYFFGLTPPAQPPLFDTWTKAEVVSFTSGCPEVASSVVYGTTSGINPNASTYGQTITKIKQVAFWRFDDKGAVIAYDAWLPSLQQYTDLLYGFSNGVNAQIEQTVIGQLCTSTQSLCQGPNQQYASVEDCQKQLSEKPFGNWDQAWSDTAICRMLHVLLARIRPDVSRP